MGEQQVEYGAIETGICPLMSSNDAARNWVYCQMEHCTWWCSDACAIVEIAKYLRGPVNIKSIKVVPGL